MIGYLCGSIAESDESSVVLECNGVGYLIYVSAITLRKLVKEDKTVKIFTHLAVREDDVSLYGFNAKAERDMFLNLISISGIGPKVAMSILSFLELEQLSLAIVTGDVQQLSKIKGIGKKTAERLVLELKDKLKSKYTNSEDNTMIDIVPDGENEAILALMALGYSNKDAAAAIKRVYKDNMSTEQLVLAALKNRG